MLSTPHRDTDVKKVLKKLRDVLQTKGLFESLAEEFETAKLVHGKMDHLIHRDTKEDIRRYVEEAGLEIRDWRDSEYADAVVVVTAVWPLLAALSSTVQGCRDHAVLLGLLRCANAIFSRPILWPRLRRTRNRRSLPERDRR